MKATNLQAQQSAEYEKIKIALVNETAKVKNEYNVKIEVTKERLAE